jgi:acetyl-CoA acetyltransferase
MKMNAYVVGVGMTRFGKHLDRSLKSLSAEAISAAVSDAGIDIGQIQAAYMANSAAGVMSGQHMIRGQVFLRAMGVGAIPVINIENACASASTAFNQAAAMVTAGAYDIVLAAAVEKLYDEDKAKSFAAFGGGVDVEAMREQVAAARAAAAASPEKANGGAKGGTIFMDFYAASARDHMKRHGTTVEQFAEVSVKNSFHGSLNERAQFRDALSLEDVLGSPLIANPLTRPMCSPIGDGAAAVVIMSERKARELGLLDSAVRVVSSVLRSGLDHDRDASGAAELCAADIYSEAGLGPNDLNVVELHDASAPAEIMAYETLGLCAAGEGGRFIQTGATRLGGRLPVNTSGGLLRKGHPVGATGIAQIVELTEQLQGRSGARQVQGARVGLAHNNGGSLGGDVAAACLTLLQK